MSTGHCQRDLRGKPKLVRSAALACFSGMAPHPAVSSGPLGTEFFTRSPPRGHLPSPSHVCWELCRPHPTPNPIPQVLPQEMQQG